MRSIQLSLFSLLLSTACGASGDDTGSSGDAGDATGEPGSSGDTSEPGDTSNPTSGDPSGADTGDPTDEPPPGSCALVEVPCADAAVQDLSLQDDKVSDVDIANTRDGDDWVSTVDASAGGTMGASMNPWVYLRFGDDGLTRVDLDDVSAIDSAAWDIAAKRYGVRVNSGTSGGSCVAVAELAGAYADVAAAPAADAFAIESYYDDACTLIEDGSGLPGNPDFRMKHWWGYTGCVTTTNVPFAVRLADGRHLKLVIEAYYQEGQDACNASGAMGTGSAIMTWRWSFLP